MKYAEYAVLLYICSFCDLAENPVFITCDESFLHKETAKKQWIRHRMNSFQHPERISTDSLNFRLGGDFIGTLKSSDIIHKEEYRGITLAMSNTLEVMEILVFEQSALSF